MKYIKYMYYIIKAWFMKHKPSVNRDIIDASTLDGKVMMGYQGWFGCPGDGSTLNTWRHWGWDIWPDTSELTKEEIYTMNDGHKVYSSHNSLTTIRHFKWMKDYELDGVFLQRFVTDMPLIGDLNNLVADVMAGCSIYGRVFAIMYDVTNAPSMTLVDTVIKDWESLSLGSDRYLHHNNKPVIGLWGFGFTGQMATPSQAKELIKYFQNAGMLVVGGVPAHWRTLDRDSQSNPEWKEVYDLFDIISPWTVGRYSDNKTIRNFIIDNTIDDMGAKSSYMPVIFPGYSAFHLQGTPFNQIPRNNGEFYMQQAKTNIAMGAKMIYVAMFDECDEGTAIYKTIEYGDQYLKLTSDIGKMLRGEV